MSKLESSPFMWLEFDADGKIDPASVGGLKGLLGQSNATDLVVISHGWKNDKTDATTLYGTLWHNACANLAGDTAKHIVIAGVLWPAKAYATDFDEGAIDSAPHQGQALALADGGGGMTDLSDATFKSILTEFTNFLGDAGSSTIAAAVSASNKLSSDAALDLVAKGSAAVGINSDTSDPELVTDALPFKGAATDPDSAQFLLSRLKRPPVMKMDETAGSALGLGTVVEGMFNGPRAAVARFLNQLTYFEMKKRAGVVGLSLASNVLSNLAPSAHTRLHLVGHSFGARLVTAAANQLAVYSNLEFRSLTLLQGAFSHNALAKVVSPGVSGAFPLVVGKPKGSISITHTHNDLACTLAYAIASRLSRDTAQAIGDANDEFGAMGANGPQKLASGVAQPDDTTRQFTPVAGKVNTFLADKFILKTDTSDAHNNVTNPECGRLLAATILA